MTNIQILIAQHTQTYTPERSFLCPIMVGAMGKKPWAEGMLTDDTGDNISERNPEYCELTAVYWAWKNLKADYIGLMHYRRYLSFMPDLKVSADGFAHLSELNADALARMGYDDNAAERMITAADITVLRPVNIPKMTDWAVKSVRAQYGAAPHHYVEDLDKAVEILTAMHPDYAEDAKRYLKGHSGWFCNLFVMRQDCFSDYCQWLFPILGKH